VPTIAQIEDAIVSRLASGLPFLRTCSSLADFFAADLAAIAGLTTLCPAAYVVYTGAEYSYKMGAVQEREMAFTVIAAVRNLRGEPAPRLGAAGETGVYEVLESIRTALTGQDCGIAIEPLLPVSEKAVSGSRDLAVYGIRFKTRCRAVI
jgi:phage gp37-like protein